MNVCSMRAAGILILPLLLLCSTSHADTMTLTPDGVSAIGGIDYIDVDLREVSGDGHTKVFLFEEGATNYFQFVMSYYDGGATDQSLPIFCAGFKLARIVISGNDALIQEIRLNGTLLVGNDDSSWGVLKARW